MTRNRADQIAGPVVLDACVLYPTVMRQVLLGLAAQGLFTPIWSSRILGEWRRAAMRDFPDLADAIAGEIALCETRWPAALVANRPDIEQRLHLPDANDVHVLATAIAAPAGRIVTLNLKDFPRRLLAAEGITARHPDAFTKGLFDQNPVLVSRVVNGVRSEAERISGQEWPLRKLMKKARLPRLGKALEGAI